MNIITILFSILAFFSNFLWRRQRYLLNQGKINKSKADVLTYISYILFLVALIGLIYNLGWIKGILLTILMFSLAIIQK